MLLKASWENEFHHRDTEYTENRILIYNDQFGRAFRSEGYNNDFSQQGRKGHKEGILSHIFATFEALV